MRFNGNNYDDLREGQQLASFDVIISHEWHDQFQSCFEIEALSAEKGEKAGVSKSEDPSPVLIASFAAMKEVLEWPTGVLHARESIVSRQPIKIGEPLRIQTRISKKFEKSDKKFIVLSIDIYKENSETAAMTVERTLVWP